MIDENMINNAAKGYCNKRYPTSLDTPFIAEGFRAGAHWAIQEFLKELWHDASEEPKENTDIIYINDAQEIDILKNYQGGHNWLYYGNTKGWAACKTICGIISWAYASDLLQKKEGSEQ